MANEEISFDFDPLSMYGMELRARLNDGNGVTPYIILGGGYMNAANNYVTINNLEAESQGFAQAGLGLNIPLGKRVLITGGVRAMVTSGTNVQDLATTNELQTHLMYNAGFKISIGGSTSKANKANSLISENNADHDKNTGDNSLNATSNSNSLAKIAVLKKTYEQELANLNLDLNTAIKSNSLNQAVLLMEQKRMIQNALFEVNAIENKLQNNQNQITKNTNQNSSTNNPQSNSSSEMPAEYLKLTPTEFQSLIEAVLKSNGDTNSKDDENEVLRKRIETLEQLMLQKESNKPKD
jgi:hypothetical protein